MGRNFFSVCHQCGVSLMHFRGQEGKWMQKFANNHKKHEESTAIYNNYVEEPPEHYADVFVAYYQDADDPGNDLAKQDSDTTQNLSHPQSQHEHNYCIIVKSKETERGFSDTITEVEQVMCSRCLNIQNIKTLATKA